MKDLHPLVVRGGQSVLGAEELGLQQLEVLVVEARRAGEHHGGQHLHPVVLRQPGEPEAGTVHQGEQPGRIVLGEAVGAQGHQHMVCLTDQLLQHPQLLNREPLKRIHRDDLPLEQAAPFQGLAQACQVVPGVQKGALHQGLIGPINQPQLPQLLGEPRPGQSPGGLGKLGGGNAAELHLVDRGEH